MALTILLIFVLLLPISLANFSPRPLVLWHGLGDSYASPGMLEFTSMIKNVHPNIFIHSVYIEEELDKDRQAGFYGNVNRQIDLVAEQLAEIPELRVGFDGVGFSQGGQFLRAYVERYNSPPVHNLLTFGSQHMGISDIPLCRPFDLICQAARRATKQAVYSSWAQANLVQAQYFRDPANLETYLTASSFLPSINNEDTLRRNGTYSKNLASLNALVLIMFTQDKTVVPKESSWFGSEVVDDFSSEVQRGFRLTSSRSIVPMHLQPLYVEDWIGLRTLNEQGGVIFDICEGEHMQIGDCWEAFVRNWTGEIVENLR
ncbi:palmitoyl-protein thioesterase [Lentinula aciculospora]|uniref:Palmitoyl-protein thioesterase 1 n=1 Tax=Lentinula aciculospora TaxID=153920 RepID=A0A9W8ZXI0_9AGAR|nr:palmitoyl-protein thioesterase [Lentinula aciculospora]